MSGLQLTDISLYLDDHACTGLFIAVVGAYGSDPQAVDDELASIAAEKVRDVLGVSIARTDIDVRVDDIDVRVSDARVTDV